MKYVAIIKRLKMITDYAIIFDKETSQSIINMTALNYNILNYLFTYLSYLNQIKHTIKNRK